MNFFLFERKTNILRLFTAIFNLLITRLSGQIGSLTLDGLDVSREVKPRQWPLCLGSKIHNFSVPVGSRNIFMVDAIRVEVFIEQSSIQ